MKLLPKNIKIKILYILYLSLLIFILTMVYKVFERKLTLQLNSLINKVKYNLAMNTAATEEKHRWLKEWKEIEETWNQIGLMVHVPYLMFQYKPNIRSPYLNTNDMGFRGKEDYSHLPSVALDANYRYVVLLGGSSAFGAFSMSDDTCISGQLERMLNENYKTGKRFKVINLSAGFYNSFQELIAYILYGLKYRPEVVITFDGFNDASVSSSVREGKRVPLASGNYYYTKEALDKINEGSLKRKKSFFTLRDNSTSWDKESQDFVNDVIKLYIKDLELICYLSEFNNTRVILTLQPIHVLENGHLGWRYDRQELEEIYKLLPGKMQEVAQRYKAQFIDFQEVFSKNREYNDYFSYSDPVHLIDKGQEIVAKHMLEKIKSVLKDE